MRPRVPIPSCARALCNTASISRYFTRSAAISMCMIGSLKSSVSSGPAANSRRASCPGPHRSACLARLIAGGLPTERLVAQVLVAKYADHRPLYRQSQILARQGIALDRSTLAFWVGYAAAEIAPLWRLMRQELLRSTKLFVDETTVPVLDPGRGRTKTGYFWVLARD